MQLEGFRTSEPRSVPGRTHKSLVRGPAEPDRLAAGALERPRLGADGAGILGRHQSRFQSDMGVGW